jgi:hypothetical protein
MRDCKAPNASNNSFLVSGFPAREEQPFTYKSSLSKQRTSFARLRRSQVLYGVSSGNEKLIGRLADLREQALMLFSEEDSD